MKTDKGKVVLRIECTFVWVFFYGIKLDSWLKQNDLVKTCWCTFKIVS